MRANKDTQHNEKHTHRERETRRAEGGREIHHLSHAKTIKTIDADRSSHTRSFRSSSTTSSPLLPPRSPPARTRGDPLPRRPHPRAVARANSSPLARRRRMRRAPTSPTAFRLSYPLLLLCYLEVCERREMEREKGGRVMRGPPLLSAARRTNDANRAPRSLSRFCSGPPPFSRRASASPAARRTWATWRVRR